MLVRFLRLFAVIALAAVATPAIPTARAAEPDYPALSGRVVDEAGVLPSELRNALTAKLAALEAKTNDRLVVVTLQSLRGRTIEDYGVGLGRHWGVGEKGKNNGALLIVAPRERRVRIEVGYGLESVLTDALSKIIIENAILPRFRADDIAGGVAQGVDDLIVALGGDKPQAGPVATAPAPTVERSWLTPTVVQGISVVAILVIFAAFAEKLWFGFLFAAFATTKLLVWLGVLSPRDQRTGWARAFNFADAPRAAPTPGRRRRRKSGWFGWTSGSSTSTSSGSSDSSSDSGGSFGGGGSSGDW